MVESIVSGMEDVESAARADVFFEGEFGGSWPTELFIVDVVCVLDYALVI